MKWVMQLVSDQNESSLDTKSCFRESFRHPENSCFFFPWRLILTNQNCCSGWKRKLSTSYYCFLVFILGELTLLWLNFALFCLWNRNKWRGRSQIRWRRLVATCGGSGVMVTMATALLLCFLAALWWAEREGWRGASSAGGPERGRGGTVERESRAG